MKSFTIPIQLRSPIWTGGSDGRPQGLKMSGVLGGMRQAFEMLVRKVGGPTCNITGDSNQRCNYERNPNVCPACRLFGCTGLARAFKISFEPTLQEGRYCCVPNSDSILKNRDHTNTPYKVDCAIATWLASITRGEKTFKVGEQKEAQSWILQNIVFSWLDKPTNLHCIPMRKNLFTGTNAEPQQESSMLNDLTRYLIHFMSLWGGLGAKVRQGWGSFDLLEIPGSSICDQGSKALAKLIESCNFNKDWDHDLPSAADCFAVEWELQSDDLGFRWPNSNRHPIDNCRQIGYAMNYRLRRHVKFYEVDNPGSIIPGLTDSQWRNIGNHLPRPQGRCPWKETLPFVRAVFGRDNAGDDDKHSGLVGVSHLFRRHDNEPWRIRLFGRLPSRYAYRQADRRVPVQILQWNGADVHQFLVNEMAALLKQTAASPVGDAKHLLKEEFGNEL